MFDPPQFVKYLLLTLPSKAPAHPPIKNAPSLTRGYSFQPTTPKGGILDSPFSSVAAEVRLQLYLNEMGVDDGETLHGFRSGCAITLAFLGIELSEIMNNVGLNCRHATLHYL